MNRYHVVIVGKYLDGPARIQAITAWAVADHSQANHIVSRKFDTQTEAEYEACRLELAAMGEAQ